MRIRDRLSAATAAAGPLVRLASLLAPGDRALAAADLGLVLLATVIPLGAALLLRLLVDALTSGRGRAAPSLVALTGAFVALLLLQKPFVVVEGWLRGLVAERLSFRVGQVVIETGAELDRLALVPQAGLRERVALVRRQATTQTSGLVQSLAGALSGWLGLVAAAPLLASVHPLLPVLLLGGAVPHVLVQLRFRAREWQDTLSRAPAAAWTDYCTQLATNARSAREIRLFGLGDWLHERWRAVAVHVLRRTDRLRLEMARAGVLWTLLSGAVVAAAYAWVVWLFATGRVSTGALVLSVTVALRIQSGMMDAGRSTSGAVRGLAFVRQLDDLWQLGREEAAARRGERPIRLDARGALELRGVTFGYPGRQPVLRNLDLTLRPGEIVALAGENGAGKTTLVGVATRLLRPQAGTVLLDGVEARGIARDDYRAQFAVLSQDYARFPLSALHNVGVGWVEHVEDVERVAEAAQAVRADVVERLPLGWGTPLSEQYRGGVQLSGGEWQQVALARVLVSPARFVILDEPTASLDPHREHEVYANLRRLLAGRSVLFITHRLWSARVADRVLLLHGGRIVEEGTHAELVAAGGRYAELWRLQVEALGGHLAPRPT